MRFAHLRHDGERSLRFAFVHADSAWPLDDLLSDAPGDLQELIERGPAELERVRHATEAALAAGPSGVALATFRHGPAVNRPPHVLAVGANYTAHAAELQLRSESALTVFALWPNSLAAHEAITSWPADLSQQVDYEAELGVIIGRPARDVTVAEALDYVFGYTAVNDITARDIQFSEAQWSRCKSFDGFTPNGPLVVTADEIPDPQALWLTTTLDGRVMQDSTTGAMVRTVAEIVSYLSRSCTLLPGTLISTGSPGGAGYSRKPPVFLRDGSTVTVTVESIGSLTTHCRIR